jgi:hypothetical protein
MAVLWVVAPCSLAKVTNVSEVLAASIIRAICQTTCPYNPEDSLYLSPYSFLVSYSGTLFDNITPTQRLFSVISVRAKPVE